MHLIHSDQQMNVTMLTGISRSAGGLYYAVSSLANALLTQGVQIEALGSGNAFSMDDVEAWGAVPVNPRKTYGPLGWSPHLYKQLINTAPNVVHQHGIWLDDQRVSSTWQRKRSGTIIISPHGMLDPWALKNSAWKKKLAGMLFAEKSLQRADCIHALCRSEAESIRAYGLNNPVAIIPNGVDLPSLSGQQQAGGEIKKLLYLGRIHPKKGIAEMLKAAVHLPENWMLTIAGWDDGGHEVRLRTMAAELGVADRVQFVGPKFGDEKEFLFRSADAFILPSFSGSSWLSFPRKTSAAFAPQ